MDFLHWLDDLGYQHKVFIGGNHDFYLEESEAAIRLLLPDQVIYLKDEAVTINGLKLWGSPFCPELPGWAFGKQRQELQQYWEAIPADTDILITHSPPLGILDKSSAKLSLGCEALLKKVQEVRPGYHVFGHIHASYGRVELEGTAFVNASILDTRLVPVNAPVSIDL